MQIVCIKEGRQDFHVGDIVHLDDFTTAIDSTYFSIADATNDEAARKAKEKADLEEVAKLQQQIADAKAKAKAGSKE